MGFNFQAGHPQDVYETGHADRVIAALRANIDPSLPLGNKGDVFILRDEMGWSWWNELKQLAIKTLGQHACPQIRATDAGNAVYVDADIDRRVVWPDGQKEKGGKAPQLRKQGPGMSWLRSLLRLGSKSPADRQVMAAMQQMMKDFGPRSGEHGALQVASLPRLMLELAALLKALGFEATRDSVKALLDSYANDDARIDDDPAIQCLCHAWLTADHAIQTRSPMWLIK